MIQRLITPYKLKVVAIAIAIAAGALIIGYAANKNAISYNKDGWEYLKKENYKKAIFSFKNALHDNPKYREALIGLGKAYFEVEAYDQAYDLFTAALAIDKKNPDTLVGLGKTLTAMGRYTEAIDHFDRALKLSEQNLDARYGTAYVYASLGKTIWAKRTLETILRMDPYHYDSLLLMADIKSSENRLKEARRFAEKAIDTNNESSKGYTLYGEILLREFLNTEDEDLLDEAKNALSNAISIQQSAYKANRTMGNVSLMEKKNANAVTYFNTAISDLDSSALLYSLAVSHDRAGNYETALDEFLKAMKKDPADSILRARMEDFLVIRDYKIGHPARVMLNRELYDLALNREKKNLPDQAVMYLRRAILLNPMNIEARSLLMDFYNTEGFNRFYIDEMKEILRINPDRAWQEKLSVAVMKRRDMLYHREGYDAEEPPRDAPVVLVLNFDPMGRISPHPDAGEVIASQLTFVLGQFGRMKPVGIRNRASVTCGLMCGGGHLDQSMESVESKIKSGDIEPVDYLVYGSYYESGNRITLECRLLDYKKGFVIGQFTVTESGKESLPRLALRAAKRIYDMIPYRGRVIKLKDTGIIVNVGLFDGINAGQKLVIYKFRNDAAPGHKLKKKILFTVKESDTLISYAEPQNPSDLDSIESNDTVLPLKKRRAKLID
jgi:tetratricopeptide (TPR) repeat protein